MVIWAAVYYALKQGAIRNKNDRPREAGLGPGAAENEVGRGRGLPGPDVSPSVRLSGVLLPRCRLARCAQELPALVGVWSGCSCEGQASRPPVWPWTPCYPRWPHSARGLCCLCREGAGSGLPQAGPARPPVARQPPAVHGAACPPLRHWEHLRNPVFRVSEGDRPICDLSRKAVPPSAGSWDSHVL